jgi:hypothetical protein
MRVEGDTDVFPEGSRSKGAQRRRRLARGIDRWDHDRQLCSEWTRRIAVVTLTLKDQDPEAAIGRVYKFWAKVRQKWLGTRYFCWLELQRRGAVHYHCIWLNPPPIWRVNLVAWVDRAWGEGRTQVRFPQMKNGLQAELDYCRSYAKKMGRKAYQQKYDEVPRALRTFMSQRLESPGGELDDHRDKDLWLYHRGGRRPAGQPALFAELYQPWVERVGHVEHVIPPGGRCSVLDHRRPAARHRSVL